MVIRTIINDQFNANTYLLNRHKSDKVCYLVDIGNADATLKELELNHEIKGIFLTHAHYDHICGIHEILNEFPNCIIYCSEYTKKALSDSKMNLSFYYQTPITYLGINLKIVTEKENIKLYEGIYLEVLETPGHNAGSLTFKINNTIFTGDSLIPGLPVVTKLKSGNKLEVQKSIAKIKTNTTSDCTIYPGHGKSVDFKDINWDFYL